MGIFSAPTPAQEELREAKRAARQAEKEHARRQAELQLFLAGPVGQARQAFERGDLLYQADFNLLAQDHAVVPMVNAYTVTQATDPTVVLNAITREGWDLHSSGFAFLAEGEESRDKFLASGQHVAVRGKMMGYYVFKRCPELKTESASEGPAPKAKTQPTWSRGGHWTV